MTTSADANPEDTKPEPETKAEPRKRKSEPKREWAPVFEEGADASAADAVKSDSAKADAGTERKGETASTGDDTETSKALAPAGGSPIDPFLIAKAEDKVESPIPPRSFASRMLDYSAHAAIIIGLIGFAWTVSGHVIGQKKDDASVTAAKSSAPAKSNEMDELRLANIKLHEEIKALKSSVDSLRTAAKRDTTPEQVRMLSAGLENVRGALGTTKSETSAAIAQLQGKIDKVAPGKMQALADRVGRLEHQSIDTPSTGSIARSEPPHADMAHSEPAKPVKAASTRTIPSEAATKSAPTPPAKPAELAKLDEKDGGLDDAKPPVLQGWVVRDVYQGVALIEGKRGTLEVVPGVAIPGAGVVKSIERKGGGWIVTTSKGQLAYAGAAAQRDYRRGGYGYGGGYGRSYPTYRDGY